MTDLRYAMGQLRPIVESNAAGHMSRPAVVDRVHRALDALERAIEAAERLERDIDARLESMDGEEELAPCELVPCTELDHPMAPCQCDYHVSQREQSAA